MSLGRVVIVSGPPGAGKSTVARALALGSPGTIAVYLHTDDFYANIVKGFVSPWLPEAHEQNRAVVSAIIASTTSYARGGFDVVVDGVFGPWFLGPWRELARDDVDVHYVVLRPDEVTTLARGSARQGPGELVDACALRNMWQKFADLGVLESHVIDTTSMTLAETLALVREAVDKGRNRLGQS